jgi:Flp pilus assembly protein TadB
MQGDASIIKTVIEAGGSTALTLALLYAVKTLWELAKSKDAQLTDEREKREELIKESILASRSMFESTEKIVQALERIERKVFDHAENH